MATQKKEVTPIIPVKKDPENGQISRDEFIEKRRKQKELEARMKAFEEKAKREIEEEMKTKESSFSVKTGKNK